MRMLRAGRIGAVVVGVALLASGCGGKKKGEGGDDGEDLGLSNPLGGGKKKGDKGKGDKPALRAAGHPDPHEGAAFDTLRESGLPTFVTSLAVTLGFLTLLLSRFVGLANLGLLIGISLLTAVFADLFLSPRLLIKLKPKI